MGGVLCLLLVKCERIRSKERYRRKRPIFGSKIPKGKMWSVERRLMDIDVVFVFVVLDRGLSSVLVYPKGRRKRNGTSRTTT
jgi:hypothetical protein